MDKKQARTLLKSKRNELSTEYRNKASKAIQHKLLEKIYKLLKEHNLKQLVVGGYYPINNEVDILPIFKTLSDENIITCLPCVVDDHIEFKNWSWGNELIIGKFCFEPLANSNKVEPNVIITPLLGFDENLNRIGYGFGYYDRYLQLHKNIHKIGVAYSHQLLEFNEHSPFDIPLDMIITETKLFNKAS
jgi:5-formyltetrahydrofolate cyclo-ligase